MARFAEITDGIVTNVLIASAGSGRADWLALADDSPVQIGWEILNGTLGPPEVPPTTEEPVEAIVDSPAANLTPFAEALMPPITIYEWPT